MNKFLKVFLGILLALVLGVVAIAAVGYGWVPLFGNRYTQDYFGAHPESWVAWYGSGWTDHQIYFIFKADRDWVERAAKFGGLVEEGQMRRVDCLATFNPPWWFDLSPRTQGVCWKRRANYAGNVKMHYAPSSGFVYVFDYST